MKRLSKFSLWTLIVSLTILASCRKEKVSSPGTTNKPPIANAGHDQITSTDSTYLDGSGSSDPDGTIVSYAWSKVSGPTGFVFSTPSEKMTLAKNLPRGSYEFVLKVTDNSGLSATDTMKLRVAGANCNDYILTATGAATVTEIGELSQARTVNPVTINGKIFFPGGYVRNLPSGNGPTKRMDIYDIATATWSVSNMPSADYGITAVSGNKLLYIGSSLLQVYDVTTNNWLSVNIPILGAEPDIAIANNKIYFAGGSGYGISFSSIVHIYDLISNSWSTANLSQARAGIATVVAGNKIYFAGGYRNWDTYDLPTDFSSRVDIYDISLGTWTTTELLEPGSNMQTAVSGSKIYFGIGGAFQSNQVNVYDISTSTWSALSMSLSRAYFKMITAGNKILFVGGASNGTSTDRVDLLNTGTSSWSNSTLPTWGTPRWSAVTANHVLISFSHEGMQSPAMNVMNVYNLSTNTWSTITLNYFLVSQPVVVNNEIFLAGGSIKSFTGNAFDNTCKLWKINF